MNRITFPLKRQMKRPEVARLRSACVLGFTIDDVEKTIQRYGASTRMTVMQFQTAQNLPSRGETDEATANAINGVLAERGAIDPVTPDVPDRAGRQVAGTVLHAEGSAISGMLVQAFHRRVGRERSLGGETLTNDRGKYAIIYRLAASISKIDLFVRAYDNQDIVAVSPIIIGAREQEILDLSVTDPKYRGPSEFARATEVLGPQVGGAKLDELDADDVTLLVRNTGIARESVTAWIAARRLAERTDIEHESLYGLIRTENTASLPRLLRHSATRLLRSLTGAAESNVILHAAGQRAATTVTQLRKLAVELSTSHNTPGSLGKLLTATKASPAQRAGFIERYANHPPRVKALRTSGVQHAVQTTTLDTEGWQQLLQTEIDGKRVGTPPNIKGATDAERQDNYITLLKERSARALPTEHVAKTLKTLPVWQSSSAVAFLDANPNFNLLTAKIKSSLGAAGAVMQPDWDRAKLETELATVQRVSRVAPRGKEEAVVNGLLGNDYTSALTISCQSRATFRRKTAASFDDEAMADTVHRSAQFQAARVGCAYALMQPFLGGGLIDAVGGISTEVAIDPPWVSLFGNVDYCSCLHCRSIYGPAAYLVDLLTWLDGHDSGNKTAFERSDTDRGQRCDCRDRTCAREWSAMRSLNCMVS